MAEPAPETRTPPPSTSPSARADAKRNVRLYVGAALGILFAVFVLLNSQEVRVHFVFFKAQIRLIYVFLLCGLAGAVLDRLLQRKGILGKQPREKRRRRGRKAA